MFLSVMAQTGNPLYDKIIRQISLFPQEKAYIFTDADSYMPGRQIYVRIFLVDAITHRPAEESRYVYVELIDSSAVVLQRVRLLRSKQGFEGYLDIPAQAKKGCYLLRAYTENMLNTRYFEQGKAVFIGGEGRLLKSLSSAKTKEVLSEQQQMEVMDEPERITVRLRLPVKNDELYLLGHCRAMPFYFKKLSSSDTVVRLEKSLLSQGILSFMLLDKDFQVKEEQAAWLDNGQEECRMAFKQCSESAEGGMQEYLLTAPDLVAGESFDVAIRVEYRAKDAEKFRSNIRSFLFLNSDLPDSADQPSTILQDSMLLSILKGWQWKRYNIGEVLSGKFRRPSKAVETSGKITGRVTTVLVRKPVQGATVNLISPDKGFYAVTKTGADGQFCFDGIDFPNGTQYVLNAFNEKGKPTVELFLDEPVYPSFAGNQPSYEWEEGELLRADTASLLTGAEHKLAEVKVMGKQPTYAARSDAYARLADFSFGLKDIESIGATCLHELIRRIPGAAVELEKVYIRGANSIEAKKPAAVVIDGVFVDEDYDLDNIQMADVERVDVFKTGSTVIWGARGGAGVVSITSKKGNFTQPSVLRSNTKKFTMLGYQVPLPFTPNIRTPYWNPGVKGREVRLWLPALHEEGFQVIIEGVTTEGRVIHEVLPWGE